MNGAAIGQIAALMDLLREAPDGGACVDELRACLEGLDEQARAVLLHGFAARLAGGTLMARARLSTALAAWPDAPPLLLGALARDGDPAVAGPVLKADNGLSESDLMSVATTLSLKHKLHLAGRPRLPEALTEALLLDGDLCLAGALARNPGARFSSQTKRMLARRALREPALFLMLEDRAEFTEALRAAQEEKALAEAQAERDIDGEVARRMNDGDLAQAFAVVAIEAGTQQRLVLRHYQSSTQQVFVMIARAAGLSWSLIAGLLLRQLGVIASVQHINDCRKVYESMSRAEARRRVSLLSLSDAQPGE